MISSRRLFLRRAAQAALAAPALYALGACAHEDAASAPLESDPLGALDLPPGFSYRILSRHGDQMSDGLFTPGRHDGMAAFPIEGDPSRCILVRNHEVRPENDRDGPFGADNAGAVNIDPAFVYDRTRSGRPLFGGTTTLIVNVPEGRVERSFLSLAGTATNCAGGPTPWGSWLSCEETQALPGEHAQKPHGFVFEVPAAAPGLVRPLALTAMGRFKHEACAVDPETGAVFQTEDEGDGLIYRFLPEVPGDLSRGGRLQALALSDRAGADTRNWTNAHRIEAGRALPVRWIEMDDVTAPNGDLRQRGHAAGAALFARGEGMAIAIEGGRPIVYFACTNGGAAKRGQIWRLDPANDKLSLFVESASAAQFDMVDNIVVAPWGDLVLCEDGDAEQFVRGVTPEGRIYPIARNAHPANSEFCGACFSPDGTTLFVNIQNPATTFAITGPWTHLARGV
jgi:secreted PhoX family phosphatase